MSQNLEGPQPPQKDRRENSLPLRKGKAHEDVPCLSQSRSGEGKKKRKDVSWENQLPESALLSPTLEFDDTNLIYTTELPKAQKWAAPYTLGRLHEEWAKIEMV